MVFKLADQYFIAWLQGVTGIGLGDQVKGFGCPTSPDYFFAVSGVDEVLDGLSCLLKLCRSGCGKGMATTMDVGIVATVVLPDCLNHLKRLLGSGCTVEVDQWLAIAFLGQGRELLANTLDIKLGSHGVSHSKKDKGEIMR